PLSSVLDRSDWRLIQFAIRLPPEVSAEVVLRIANGSWLAVTPVSALALNASTSTVSESRFDSVQSARIPAMSELSPPMTGFPLLSHSEGPCEYFVKARW